MGRNLGDIRIWRDTGSGLGRNGDRPFDEREFTTRKAMKETIFPATENDEGSIVPQGGAEDKNWTYFWHHDDPHSESSWMEKETLRDRGWTLATTDRFRPNRDYYRIEGNKIYSGRKILYVLPEERWLENKREDDDLHDKIMGGLNDPASLKRIADTVSIKSSAFDNVTSSEPVKPRSKR